MGGEIQDWFQLYTHVNYLKMIKEKCFILVKKKLSSKYFFLIQVSSLLSNTLYLLCTGYEPQQQEKCDENFKKSCYIEYKVVTHDEMVEVCQQGRVKNCQRKVS